MNEEIWDPGENLVTRGEDNFNLFFLNKGCVNYILEKQKCGQDLVVEEIKQDNGKQNDPRVIKLFQLLFKLASEIHCKI